MNWDKKMGVRGTPALLLSNGDLLPGYVPPKRLVSLLEKVNKKDNIAEK